MQIIKEQGVALYHQLAEIIINLIDKKELKENDKIPSERELCDMYNISRTTARQALSELERKGYIYKEHGKGTFVSPKIFNQQLFKFYSFTEEMKKLGKEPTSKLLGFDLIRANEEIAHKLKIKENDQIYKITRLRLADNEAMMVENTYLPESRFPDLGEKLLLSKALYEIFKEKYFVKITRATETFKSVIMNKIDSNLLNSKSGMAAMKIERITYESETVIEYTVSIARGDKFEYTVNLD
ncbi:GntR family transcriptional regulator [Clostridium fallax]|uniref:Transcriptional regulator, GntR family n=1 Tax=Clostridium fallax TaxID=1533 RepID=A0A1M4W4P4_9CLOT|nr:GntR family transcriptional regulator [Clostridium fallax]SHE76196.1 transcriptional regulator, GntR family [Clostridium fallax]SQB22879.1 GntR family transcriptional regulator [Clostridium fallax]